MNKVAIIQARMGGERLPGKIMRRINGSSMLRQVVSRVECANLVDSVVAATPDKGLPVPKRFVGSEDDVLDRYYQCAEEYKADVIIRITADCPLIDPILIDSVISCYMRGGIDYASNIHPKRTYPRGLDVEVFSKEALKEAWEKSGEREHVTSYIWQNDDKFNIALVKNDTDFSNYRWTVDVEQDMAFVRWIYAILGDKFYWRDVLELCQKYPELTKINDYVDQKPL